MSLHRFMVSNPRTFLVYVAVSIGTGVGSGSAARGWQPEPLAGLVTSEVPISSQTVTIPDGTHVELRFAQPLRGMTRGWMGRVRVSARIGDSIRLVASEDVRIGGLEVIAKGAAAQGTVTNVWLPSVKDPQPELETGLEIRFDWVEDVTGHRISLRPSEKGKAQPFVVVVDSKHGSLVARPGSFKRGMVDILTYKWMITEWHRKDWVPTGTRITGFVQGEVALELAEVKEAESLLPVPNGNAVLTLYRTKGHADDATTVFCDEKQMASLSALQYAIVELAPGKHSCRVSIERLVDISVNAGEEYYLQVSYKKATGKWTLQQVKAGEGEDHVANCEPASPMQ